MPLTPPQSEARNSRSVHFSDHKISARSPSNDRSDPALMSWIEVTSLETSKLEVTSRVYSMHSKSTTHFVLPKDVFLAGTKRLCEKINSWTAVGDF